MGGTLMRSRVDRKIAGVCGGIARNQGWDSNLVRLIWVALVLFGGTGLLAYVVLWVVLPEEPIALPHSVGYPPPVQGYAGYPPTQAPPYPPQGPPASYSGAPAYQGPDGPPQPGPQAR